MFCGRIGSFRVFLVGALPKINSCFHFGIYAFSVCFYFYCLKTLWTLENYLTDWQGGTTVRQHQLYDRCARFLGEVQAVVFGEHLFRIANLNRLD